MLLSQKTGSIDVVGETSAAGVGAKELISGPFRMISALDTVGFSRNVPSGMVVRWCLPVGTDGCERPNTRNPSNPVALLETVNCAARVGLSPRLSGIGTTSVSTGTDSCCPPELSSHREAGRDVFTDVVSNVLFLEVLSFFVSKRGKPESVVMEGAIMCLSRTRPRKRGPKLLHGNSSPTVVTKYLPID